MCGIVGTFDLFRRGAVDEEILRRMLAALRHRGPDQSGIYLDDRIGLGSARLSIIDLSGGQQPISNEDRTLWIVYNGEVFNYLELRAAAEARGHRFTTSTDTEVILHLYEDYGPQCLHLLNGQFAIAIWDSQQETLFLARDRLGIRPLFYTLQAGTLLFASEIKALLADRRIKAEIDLTALDQIFTFWSTLPPRTIFDGIFELPPGHFMMVKEGDVSITPYWQLSFPDRAATPPFSYRAASQELHKFIDEFRSLLVDATCLRLRADVPVGAYLSGGLDSSTTAAIIRNFTSNRLETFSIAFSDPQYDESQYQHRMARHLGTDHHVLLATHADIGRVFPAVIWHTETPVLRTSPAPMYLLSRLVNDHHYKVVLTGEGADEFLAGYDIFKEAVIRRFWARQPQSKTRPALFKRIYADIANLSNIDRTYLAAFFGQKLCETDDPGYSHAIRWSNTSRTRRFFSDEVRQYSLAAAGLGSQVSYPPEFSRWHPLHQAQYLEAAIFLPQYLLSSQGDRMAMAHSVEGRFPFLDYRVVEFCNQLPPELKLHGLDEKYLLKKLAQEWLPEEIIRRPKRPYRAPIQRCFFGQDAPDYVDELLSEEAIRATGLFNAQAAGGLAAKARSGSRLSETDEMALVGILSTQLVYEQFIHHFQPAVPLIQEEVRVVNRGSNPGGAFCDRSPAHASN